MPGFDTVILDLDGTLVDSVYHHVVAWQRAFRDVGLSIPATRIHEAIGMGGDRLVAHVGGDSAERSVGDEIRAAHAEHFATVVDRLSEVWGASELVEQLAADHAVVLATSADAAATEDLLQRVEARAALRSVVTGSDVSASKPAPDILLAALDSVDGRRGLVVGDAVWDIRAARSAEMPAVGLLSGGIPAERLLDEGADSVYDDAAALARRLRATGLDAVISVRGAP